MLWPLKENARERFKKSVLWLSVFLLAFVFMVIRFDGTRKPDLVRGLTPIGP